MAVILEGVFGHGDDDHPLWLLAVRLDVLAWLAALAIVAARGAARVRLADLGRRRGVLLAAATCTAAGVGLRLWATGNLLDTGGIPYSRLLTGYRGHFGAAQAYGLVYALTRRDLDHAILLDRLVGAATVPCVFALCRALRPRSTAFAFAASALLALHPLHVLFSASDALSPFSGFLCALSWACVAAEGGAPFVAGLLGLALLTQVRYEDALFVVPPVVWLAARRRWARAAACAAAGLVFLGPSVAAGISFDRHARLAETWRMVTSNEILGNPVLGLGFLFGATLLVALSRRPLLVVAALAPWAAATALVLGTAESAHHAARAFSNWLVPICLAAGLGLSLLAERGHLGAAAVAIALVHFAARPARYAEVLRTRYLEIAEHEAFAAMLAAAPPDARAVVVPDDERMRRREHATVETMEKYAAIRAGLPREAPPLVGITALADGRAPACDAPGVCLFFRGLPCTVESVNRDVRPQCEALARERSLEPVAEATVTGAPFERCAILAGNIRRDLCARETRTVTFAMERVR